MAQVNPIATNPVLTKDIGTLVVWLAAKYGFKVSFEEATAISAVLFLALSPFVRQLVKPVAKLEPTSDPKLFAEQVHGELLALERAQGDPVPAKGMVSMGVPPPVPFDQLPDNAQAQARAGPLDYDG
jgi:hypothetical protein